MQPTAAWDRQQPGHHLGLARCSAWAQARDAGDDTRKPTRRPCAARQLWPCAPYAGHTQRLDHAGRARATAFGDEPLTKRVEASPASALCAPSDPTGCCALCASARPIDARLKSCDVVLCVVPVGRCQGPSTARGSLPLSVSMQSVPRQLVRRWARCKKRKIPPTALPRRVDCSSDGLISIRLAVIARCFGPRGRLRRRCVMINTVYIILRYVYVNDQHRCDSQYRMHRPTRTLFRRSVSARRTSSRRLGVTRLSRGVSTNMIPKQCIAVHGTQQAAAILSGTQQTLFTRSRSGLKLGDHYWLHVAATPKPLGLRTSASSLRARNGQPIGPG